MPQFKILNRLFDRLNQAPLTIEPQQSEIISLGQFGRFSLVYPQKQALQIRAFITYGPVYYQKPLFDWSSQREILFFPEAPGDYVLNVEWMQGSRRGWVSERFSVAVAPASLPVPTQVMLEPELCLWTPSSWEAEMIRHHERGVIDFLRSLIRPGWTIYDIGANLGLFSVVFSQLTTSQGQVYCVEANPLCVYFLRANLAQNQVSNALVFPVALGKDATPVDFTINYGNSNLGVTTLSSIYTQKTGHTITAGAISLDQLIEQFKLLPPKMIKIDIEGAEEVVIAGMKATLQRHRPVLLMELHGETAARNTLSFLAPFQYIYLDLNTRQQFASAADLIAVLGEHIYQVAAFPNLRQMNQILAEK